MMRNESVQDEEEIKEANARLIADAPELLSALEALYLNANMIVQRLNLEDRETPVGMTFPCRGAIPVFTAAVDKARAALAAAKGVTP